MRHLMRQRRRLHPSYKGDTDAADHREQIREYRTVVFEDINRLSGITGWFQKLGAPERKFIVETNGQDADLRPGLDRLGQRLAVPCDFLNFSQQVFRVYRLQE
jgi:hypothetical protein